jgi:hypothetical protein
MVATVDAGGVVRSQQLRQVQHWKEAARRLNDFDTIAAPQAWQSLEHYLGVSLRQALRLALDRLCADAGRLDRRLRTASDGELPALRSEFVALRSAFLRTETSVDFYADALSTRAIPQLAALLRACDHLATRSMAEALTPLGREVPAALSYLDRGLGASILKAGLRLWDGTADNPVAAIKVVRHNVLRPTALIHEAGHQVSHMLGWNEELATALRGNLTGASPTTSAIWASWASEIAADAFAFAHTGYAELVALHDVLDGSDAQVFQFLPGDPHPQGWIRMLAGVEWCRRAYGAGPWDDLASAWMAVHPLSRAPADVQALLEESVSLLPKIAELTLYAPYRAFGGVSLSRLIDPQRVSPLALDKLQREAGAAAFSSPYWIWNEALRLLAATGYRTGVGAGEVQQALEQQERWMMRLGTMRLAA